MQYIAFILNLPWTLIGLITGLLSIPRTIHIHFHPFAIVFQIRSFWWYHLLPGKEGTRAITNGHVIQLGPLMQPLDLEHELIHVEQVVRRPFIHPILYVIENLKHGYRHNKYEKEAYRRSGNTYKTK